MFARTMLTALSTLIGLGGSVHAEMQCTFDTLHTTDEILGLDDYGFRVRNYDGDLHLEQRYADGSWQSLGLVQRLQRPEFRVFIHVPTRQESFGRVQILTVHRSGNGSLMIHHGRYGSASQSQKAWLYHGHCGEIPDD